MTHSPSHGLTPSLASRHLSLPPPLALLMTHSPSHGLTPSLASRHLSLPPPLALLMTHSPSHGLTPSLASRHLSLPPSPSSTHDSQSFPWLDTLTSLAASLSPPLPWPTCLHSDFWKLASHAPEHSRQSSSQDSGVKGQTLPDTVSVVLPQ